MQKSEIYDIISLYFVWGEIRMINSILCDTEYKKIIEDYLNDDLVQALKNIPHHDSNRLEHSLKVSYEAYKICKKHNLNYESAAKAGLLHDFYFNRIEECNTIKDKIKLFSNEHPEDAVKNALERFELSDLEQDIIISHMWPTSKHMPKYKESFVVSAVDKMFSAKEFATKFNYSFSLMAGSYFIFIMYSIFK